MEIGQKMCPDFDFDEKYSSYFSTHKEMFIFAAVFIIVVAIGYLIKWFCGKWKRYTKSKAYIQK